ncbi:type II secretion system minor pseudopilin GspK [Paucibacter sp. PLA-PC-4]|uniref:type II secretion system minor pseudopilin GspK n=1 Tax=Paucibacter sp. PLA-PC-4 TaxID=2993655 RepID=UPI002248E484|nr:type II secretion system minor pseudopilin GspK [Paucibacter sp. PLA-PC-4]MCX2861408.1 type II secretion system minor pseudopilin GspK [Paucibacter sp. PLA-PC-4]
MSHDRSRGAALLTALLIVALVASLASAMVWRQYRAVQIEAADRARAQSAWILQGALDWARLILREDARANRNDPVDHLGEVWAVPLAEARLSTFLAADRTNAGEGASEDDGPEAFLSGTLLDAQAQYNLRNLVGGDEAAQALELRTLTRLCESAGVPADTAAKIASQLRAALAEKPEAQAPLRPQTLEQLQWLGIPVEIVARLRPVLTLLPARTPVNLNTAPREVIAALFEGMDLASAERVVQQRQHSPMRNLEDAKALLPEGVVPSGERAAFVSSYFIVNGRLRLEERVLEERSLVQRRDLEMLVLNRQRVNLVLEAGR